MEKDTKEFMYVWSREETTEFIQRRSHSELLFTGWRNAARSGWETVLKEMGLGSKVTGLQAARKWENLKKKYRELKYPPTGLGVDFGDVTAASWPWYYAMDEALGQKASITPPVLMASLEDSFTSDTEPSTSTLTRPAPPASTPTRPATPALARSAPPASTPTRSAPPALTISDPTASTSDAPTSSASVVSAPVSVSALPTIPATKKPKKRVANEILDFLKEDAAREEERERKNTEFNECFLALFESVLKK
ncbi:hypothetical protein SKAU_G00069970 [Synaphobranchus kaupii]|uniref:Myb/SANT-like DNA-binding domain-containing protein n=1 Tax=Synaphobranchus kaupii TaxID=118154 RepID=A0A9Q1G6L3_SYNKA|nr:hypothetical protein SKAU_G00069970 [Synaphobranchus kaupii]